MVNLKTEKYGTAKGSEVTRCIWTTKSGFSVTAISYGGLITHIHHPDRNGDVKDINLGFDSLDDWVSRNVPYFGAPMGRCANRVKDGKFSLDGKTYSLNKNQGENTLHGGIIGYDKVLWKTTVDGTKVIFSYFSCDGEEGYPGNVIVNLTYDVKDDDSLYIEFFAVSDQATIFNMTHHAYLNLAGHDAGAQGVYDLSVSVNADKYTETDETNVPTGKILPVGDTLFDLRIPRKIGDLIVNNSNLFDCNLCVNNHGQREGEQEMRFVARASHPSSGRYIEVHSDQPGVQIYTGNNLPTKSEPPITGKDTGNLLHTLRTNKTEQLLFSDIEKKAFFIHIDQLFTKNHQKGGVCYERHGAICFETQNFPDAINHPNFPSPILRPGQVYRHRVSYLFGADK